MAHLQAVEGTALLSANVAAAKTGSYIDLQGFITRTNMKAVLISTPGTTAGTCGATIRGADDTAGTNEEVLVTFTTQTSAGGYEEKHFSAGVRRYLRAVGSFQTGKDMDVNVIVLGEVRARP